jgi:hypothetical protein
MPKASKQWATGRANIQGQKASVAIPETHFQVPPRSFARLIKPNHARNALIRCR